MLSLSSGMNLTDPLTGWVSTIVPQPGQESYWAWSTDIEAQYFYVLPPIGDGMGTSVGGVVDGLAVTFDISGTPVSLSTQQDMDVYHTLIYTGPTTTDPVSLSVGLSQYPIVPEPATWSLLAASAALLSVWIRRRRPLVTG